MKKIMVLLFSITLVVMASAGDLSVDNLTVSGNAAIQGKLEFYSTGGSTNTNSVVATGGTITTNGNYRIHTFTNSGTFTVSSGSITCDVLIVAGGGSGGVLGGGGGGGGGVIITNTSVSGSNVVTVGSGGVRWKWTGDIIAGRQGSNSVFGNLTAYGGGYGGIRAFCDSRDEASIGGSGGGGADTSSPYDLGAAGISGQGFNGGDSGGAETAGGGGGGAGANGADSDGTNGGNGGNGAMSSISGSQVYYGGGGGGGVLFGGGSAGTGGSGGGGDGGTTSDVIDCSPNTGGGGGGSGYNGSHLYAGAGGSGIVIVRYSTTQTSSSNTTVLSISSNGINQANSSSVNSFMGDVGIGTANPSEKLHVAGNARVDGTLTATSILLGDATRTNWPSGAQGALMATNNLLDVPDKSAARDNLGLGSVATYDAGSFITTNGDGSFLTNITAAQVGALSTNAGALLSANNLSDLADAGIARTNLGLGSAAIENTSAFLSSTGGVVNGSVDILYIPAKGDLVMGSYTNQ
jgi:hypothetical protein